MSILMIKLDHEYDPESQENHTFERTTTLLKEPLLMLATTLLRMYMEYYRMYVCNCMYG